MSTPTAIITEALAPAVAISAVGLLILGVNNRIGTVTTRVRGLTQELRQSNDACRIQNIRQQIPLLLKRAAMIRNAIFLMFAALGMMVFTAVSIALTRLQYLHWDLLPIWTFLIGLTMIFIAVVIEAYETVLNLKTLSIESEYSHQASAEACTCCAL